MYIYAVPYYGKMVFWACTSEKKHPLDALMYSYQTKEEFHDAYEHLKALLEGKITGDNYSEYPLSEIFSFEQGVIECAVYLQDEFEFYSWHIGVNNTYFFSFHDKKNTLISTSIVVDTFNTWKVFLENKEAKNQAFYETVLEGIDKQLIWLNLQPAEMQGKQQMEKDLLAAHKYFSEEQKQQFPIQEKVAPMINQLTEKIQRLKEKQKNGALLLREQVQLDYLQKINAADTTTALNSLIAELQMLTNIDNDTRKYLIRQVDTKIAGL